MFELLQKCNQKKSLQQNTVFLEQYIYTSHTNFTQPLVVTVETFRRSRPHIIFLPKKMDYANLSFRNDPSKSTLPNYLSKLWSDNYFVDVTLATADNKQINAHKVILGSASTFFQEVLLKNQHRNPLIYLKDVKYAELALVLEFIYLGQCEVKSSELEAFLTCASELNVSGIREDFLDNLNKTEESSPLIKTDLESLPNYTLANMTNVEHGAMQYACTFNTKCKRVLRSVKNLEMHLKIRHYGPKKYSCSKCNQKFRNNRHVMKHMLIHERVDITCDICGKVRSSQKKMDWHKRAEHLDYQPVCFVCQKSFETKAKIRSHQKSCCSMKNKAKYAALKLKEEPDALNGWIKNNDEQNE